MTSLEHERRALGAHADAYLSALLARDPRRLALHEQVRFTENGQQLALGRALWRTITGVTDYRIDVADPTLGQICVLTMVLENDMPAFLSLRLRLKDDKIGEIETLVGRTGHGGPERPRRLDQADASMSAPLAPPSRSSRVEMVAIADAYFEGLVNPSVRPSFDIACNRFENGVQTTNLADPAAAWASWNCEQQYHAGFSKMVEANRDRRYAAINEERGLVYAMIVMEFAGDVRSLPIADGSTFTPPDRYLQPRTLLAHEVIKIADGKLQRLESIYTLVPYGAGAGW